MLVLGEKAADYESAREILKEVIKSGKALEKLKELVESQGGDGRFVDDPGLFETPSIIKPVFAKEEGYIKSIKADDIGIAALVLGAGRETKESVLDLSVGIMLHKKIGDFVKKGEAIATIYANDEGKRLQSEEKVLKAYTIVSESIEKKKLIKGIVTKSGIKKF